MTEGYLRFPSLHGDRLAFTAEDDVWVAPLDAAGGVRAWRLTDDRAPVADAAISPDGAWVAHLSAVDGIPEVRVVPTAGGPARRLTWWGDPLVRVLGWTPDGRVAAASAVGEPLRSRTWARAVPLDGGPPERLPFGPVTGLAHGVGGAVAVTTGFGGRRLDYAWWKRYRGGTASKLWVDPDGSGEFTPLHGLPGQVVRPMWVGGRLALLSDHEGHGNVYSCRPDGSDLRRHTDHEGAYARQAGTDGQRVVYAVAGQLWLLEDLSPTSMPRRLDVRAPGPRSGRAPAPLSAAQVAAGLGHAAPDRTGRAAAVEVRGTVHWLTAREGPARALAAQPGVRARLPRPLGELQVVWVTDADGEDALEVSPADGRAVGTPPTRLAAGRLGRVLHLAAAPDGSAVAVATHDGRVVLVDTATGEHRVLATTTDDAASGLAFSPDSRWLAWTSPGPEPLSAVRLARLADGLVLDAGPLRFTDSEPVFTLDGRHLAFLSRRVFDPVYDELVFDLSFPVGTRPQLLPLAAGTPSPFAPRREGRPAGPPDPRPEAGRPGTDPRQDAPAHGAAELLVDAEGLAGRVVPVPVPAARYSSLRAVAGGEAGGLVWLRHPVHGETGEDRPAPDAPAPRPVLERLDLATGRVVVLAEGVDAVEASGDGSRLLVRDGDALRVVPADRPAPAGPAGADASGAEADPDARVEVGLDRLRVELDPGAEWRQMFEESWRLLRDHFWAPDLAGVDGDAVLARYRPVLERVATHDDLVDLLWELHGELGTSHAYVVPPPRPVEDERRLGVLGADLAPAVGARGERRWRVSRVVPPEPADARARSPLAAPGAGVRPGDAVLAVDGREVDPVTGPGPLLVGAAQRPVELLIEGGTGERRSAVVVPLRDERPLRYHDWVADRRAAVHEATGRRAGYLHVPDMVSTGWAQLHRDLRTEVARDALVLDVRGNSGGHTSQLVVERLARRVVGWQVGRGWQPDTYPSNARRGPLVCLSDEDAGSDGDIVTAVVQQLGLGPVVGTRTWGGVVGIDGRYTLVDGTAVTQPRYAFWFPGRGWGVENHGVDPDVEVPFPPQAWAAGRDPQLDAALELLLAALEAGPPSRPPDVATRPSRAAPPLPPRRATSGGSA